ncbi:MAG: erythromycin biosynthesis sensory transduction protein eryC1, partial [Magnetospirillum sp.]
MTAATPIPFLDLVAPHRQLKAEIMEAIGAAMDCAGFIGGPHLVGFEAEFAAFCGVPHAIGVANGTDALRLALLALGIGPGDRVVTVPNTFIATTEAISQVGAAIDFVDIDPDTCLMDVPALEDFLVERFERGPLERRPKAIIPVHLYGQCADMDSINALARRFGIVVLEDAAQAHGA